MTDECWKVSLAPQASTRWEDSHELTDANRYPLDTDVIRRTKDAWLVDDKFLPLLAWERSVDIWWEGQSESLRRIITDESFKLHRLKGKKAGLKRYLELAGAEVALIEAPPLMAFPGRDWTDAERQAWLDRFPQLRTFKYRDRGQVAGACYLSDTLWESAAVPFCLVDDPASPCAKFLVTVNGFEYFGYHTLLWDHGVETPLTTYSRIVIETDKTVNQYDWIALPANVDARWFLEHELKNVSAGMLPNEDNAEIGYFFTGADPLAERTVSVFRDMKDYRDNNEFFTTTTVKLGLRPIYIKPERVMERWSQDAPAHWFLDHPNAMPFLIDDDLSEYHIYDRIYLHDTNRGPVPTPPGLQMFLDHTWFQFPVFTSLSKVGIKLTLPPFGFFQYMRGYMVDIDMSPYHRVVDAARSASAARDRTWLNTSLHGRAPAGVGRKSGTLVCGQQVRL